MRFNRMCVRRVGAAVLLRQGAGAEGREQAAHGKVPGVFPPVPKRQIRPLAETFEGLQSPAKIQGGPRAVCEGALLLYPLAKEGARYGRQTRGKEVSFRQR